MQSVQYATFTDYLFLAWPAEPELQVHPTVYKMWSTMCSVHVHYAMYNVHVRPNDAIF